METRLERAIAAAKLAIERSESLRAESQRLRAWAKATMAAALNNKDCQKALLLWFSLACMASSIASFGEEFSFF